MTIQRIAVCIVAFVGAAGVLVAGQEREDRTLLTQAQMTAIINEASGERAMHHVLELVGYQRVRLPVEYRWISFRKIRTKTPSGCCEILCRWPTGGRCVRPRNVEWATRPSCSTIARFISGWLWPCRFTHSDDTPSR